MIADAKNEKKEEKKEKKEAKKKKTICLVSIAAQVLLITDR